MAAVPSAADSVFVALAAPVRRHMLEMLAERDMRVTELAQRFDMSLSAVSQHLSVLRDANLVSQRKDGRQRICSINPAPLRTAAEWLDFYERFWRNRLDRLGTYLDALPAEEPQ